jgi:class 3 adenylate cyclase
MTDIVDSTELSVRLGDARMSELWAEHDRVARSLLREWNGREIDRSDGFLLLFEATADAVAFVLRYHQALASLSVPLSSRAGLHVGLAGLRENSAEHIALGAKSLEVDGVAKSIAGRVMSLSAGGQTILTIEAIRALGPTQHRLQSHGHWRLKGVIDPIELFEVGDDTGPFSPPPDHPKCYRIVKQGDTWLPLREVRHGLPAERDEFVGRKEALLNLAARFDAGARLVSVLGTGGCGKTRLATRYAWTWLGNYPGGSWFCDLSQARGIDGIVAAVARGLNVPLGKDDPVLQLGNAIAGHGECLVILDNFEQVVRHAEGTLGQWLDRAGKARFLVTTREVLGIPGEHTVALPPLAAREAEALFMRRARAAKSGFNPPPDDRAAIEKTGRDAGSPAVGDRALCGTGPAHAPRQLLHRMGERFRLLSSSGGRQDRQATLRAALDWSWDLLTAAEKHALAQLSVFEGGFVARRRRGSA